MIYAELCAIEQTRGVGLITLVVSPIVVHTAKDQRRLMMKVLSVFLLVLLLLGAGTYAYASNTTIPISLGTSASFGVLAGSGVTNVSSATMITGNVGSSPTPAVTGLLATQVIGTLYEIPSPVTAQAQVDLTTAYGEAASAPCTTNLTGQDLGGLTLVPGVYCFSSSATLTGTLTLDAQGDTNAYWIFQMGSTLTTATNSSVVLINSARDCNVYWQVGSSATIQTGSTFVGTILALTSITLDGGTLDGRALANNGAVTIAAQETIDNAGCGNCTVFISSSSRGTVTRLDFQMPYNAGGAVQTTLASGLTSAEGLACSSSKYLYVAQSGVYGGPLEIVKFNEAGQHVSQVVDFQDVPGLAESGGPIGLSFQPVTDDLFFSTTLSNGYANTGAWSMVSNSPVQEMLPFAPNGKSNGGGGMAFLTRGRYAGDLVAVDVANYKVVRIPAPFTSPQEGIDFITSNLTTPYGITVDGVGSIFVSNTDGTIEQFSPSGVFLGQFAATGFHNTNVQYDGVNLMVATADGPVIWIVPDGTQQIVGTIAGGDGLTACPH
jgi:hypothetical protein